jgi:hypothetical protein
MMASGQVVAADQAGVLALEIERWPAYKAWAATPVSAREAAFLRAADPLWAKSKSADFRQTSPKVRLCDFVWLPKV